MRTKEETAAMETVKNNSRMTKLIWTSLQGEIFEYEDCKLVAYTDTRVIDHETDRLVDLSTHPFMI